MLLHVRKATNIKPFVKALEDAARQSGAKSLRIVGHKANELVRKPGLAEKLGFSFRTLENGAIELFKNLP